MLIFNWIKSRLQKTAPLILTILLFCIYISPVNGTTDREILTVDFEQDLFQFMPRGGDEVLTVTDEDAYSGTYSLKTTDRYLSWHGPALEASQWITVGYEYEVSIWVRVINESAGNIRLSAQIGRFGSANYINIAVLPVSVEDGWVQLKGSLLYPHNAHKYVALYVEHDDWMAEYLIDDLTVIELGVLSAPDSSLGTAVKSEDIEAQSWYLPVLIMAGMLGICCVSVLILYHRRQRKQDDESK